MDRFPLISERLTLRLIEEGDAPFLIQLVQTDGWLRFIGERKISGPGEAEAYIRNILDDPGKEYLVITLKEKGEAIGILSFLQRDSLEYPDFGFALLPAHENQGYALEASRAFLTHLAQSGECPTLLAITMPENQRSVRLLSKLGFRYVGEVVEESNTLSLYELNS